MSSIELQPVTLEQNLDIFCDIEVECFGNGAYEREYVQKLLRTTNAQAYLVLSMNIPIGSVFTWTTEKPDCTVECSSALPDASDIYVNIESIAVLPAYRQKGYAKEILRLAEDRAAGESLKGKFNTRVCFTSQIAQSNEASHKLFKGSGYHFIQAFENFYDEGEFETRHMNLFCKDVVVERSLSI